MRVFQQLKIRTLAVMILFLLSVGGVSAHHSRAGYDRDKVITLEGVVTELVWRNPHVFVMIDVKDQNDKVQPWVGELSSVSTMMAAGMNRNSVKVGDEIVVTMRPALVGTPHGLVDSIVKADGAVVLAGEFRGRTR